jgi:hypothetical protein
MSKDGEQNNQVRRLGMWGGLSRTSMNLSWNTTIDGKQYFVSINKEHRLEYSFDNVNPQVGGGYTAAIDKDMSKNKWVWDDIIKVFGHTTAREMYALALTIEKLNFPDEIGPAFYTMYDNQLQKVIADMIFG